MSMTLEQKNRILFDALKEASIYMCKFPPAQIPYGEYKDILGVMIGSGINPEESCMKYMAYFIDKAKEKGSVEDEKDA